MRDTGDEVIRMNLDEGVVELEEIIEYPGEDSEGIEKLEEGEVKGSRSVRESSIDKSRVMWR